jgi:hypothetical protein
MVLGCRDPLHLNFFIKNLLQKDSFGHIIPQKRCPMRIPLPRVDPAVRDAFLVFLSVLSILAVCVVLIPGK